jgi:hypothetical protein
MTTQTDYVTIYDTNSTRGAANFQEDYDKDVVDIQAIVTPSSYWCLCDVPFEDYPIGVTTSDPSGIDADYLTAFGVEDYDGDVITHVVNSTREVKDNVDTSFTDEKMVNG